MHIEASVRNSRAIHEVAISTDGGMRNLQVPAKASGDGSAVNGGEFLMLALATCYCNDLYREAARLGIQVDAVSVRASADFEGVGLAASNIRYSASIRSDEPQDRIEELLRKTDSVAEIHNTIRSSIAVTLTEWKGQN